MLVTVQRWTPETARLTFDAARVVEVPFDVDENVRYFTINNDGSQSETEFWSMIEEGIEDGERVIDYDVSFSVTINDDGWEVTFHNGDDPLLGTWEEVVVFAVAALS